MIWLVGGSPASPVPITPEMSFLLKALRGYPVSTDVQEQLEDAVPGESSGPLGRGLP